MSKKEREKEGGKSERVRRKEEEYEREGLEGRAMIFFSSFVLF